MVELSKQSCLPLEWDSAAKRLLFGPGLEGVKGGPVLKYLGDMSGLFFEDGAAGPEELYYIYRDIALDHDREAVKVQRLRHDITVINTGTIGKEFIKTAGHFNPLIEPGADLTYPEVSEVLFGRGHYLLQRSVRGKPEQLESVLLISARHGDKVLIPPGYGHVIINPGQESLIISTWSARDLSSVHGPYRQFHGAAYYELQGEEGPVFLSNNSYLTLPPLQRCPVTPVPSLNLFTGLPLYKVFQDNNSVFRFLVTPGSFLEIFKNYLQELTQKN